MLISDILLLILIVICIVYCWVLSRNIRDLNNSRVEFARMIQELNVYIEDAQKNVAEMSELGKVTVDKISKSVDDVNKTSDEVATLIKFATDINKRLEENINKVKNLNLTPNVNENIELEEHNIENQEHNEDVENEVSDNLIKELFRSKTKYNKDNSSQNKVDSTISSIKGLFRKQKETVNKPKDDDGMSLNQKGYYDIIKRVNTKK